MSLRPHLVPSDRSRASLLPSFFPVLPSSFFPSFFVPFLFPHSPFFLLSLVSFSIFRVLLFFLISFSSRTPSPRRAGSCLWVTQEQKMGNGEGAMAAGLQQTPAWDFPTPYAVPTGQGTPTQGRPGSPGRAGLQEPSLWKPWRWWPQGRPVTARCHSAVLPDGCRALPGS